MTILAFILWFVTALFALGVVTHNKDTQPKNKVHFYVARDKDERLWLYMGNPVRADESFVSSTHGKVVINSPHFIDFGLNENDYKDLKWEDEPVEVFLNLEE